MPKVFHQNDLRVSNILMMYSWKLTWIWILASQHSIYHLREANKHEHFLFYQISKLISIAYTKAQIQKESGNEKKLKTTTTYTVSMCCHHSMIKLGKSANAVQRQSSTIGKQWDRAPVCIYYNFPNKTKCCMLKS